MLKGVWKRILLWGEKKGFLQRSAGNWSIRTEEKSTIIIYMALQEILGVRNQKKSEKARK